LAIYKHKHKFSPRTNKNLGQPYNYVKLQFLNCQQKFGRMQNNSAKNNTTTIITCSHCLYMVSQKKLDSIKFYL